MKEEADENPIDVYDPGETDVRVAFQPHLSKLTYSFSLTRANTSSSMSPFATFQMYTIQSQMKGSGRPAWPSVSASCVTRRLRTPMNTGSCPLDPNTHPRICFSHMKIWQATSRNYMVAE